MVGFKTIDYDVSRLTPCVYGYIIAEHITAREALEQLQAAYFFDVVESDGILKFTLRLEGQSVATINEEELVPSKSGDIQATLEMTLKQELELPQKVSLTHIDARQNYDLVTVQSQRQAVSTAEQVNFSLPLVLDDSLAKQIADITLYNAWQERINYGLTLMPKYAYLEPTDIINVYSRGTAHQMRIIKTDMQHSGVMKVIASSFNLTIYDFYSNTNYLIPNYEIPKPIASTILELIDAPPLPSDLDPNRPKLKIAATPDSDNWQSALIYQSTNEAYDYRFLTLAPVPATIGVALNLLLPGPTVIFDRDSEVIVQLLCGTLSSVSELALLGGANAALIDDELVQFQNAELTGDRKYKLTKLLRGRQGTEWAIGNHKIGSKFILLSGALTSVNLTTALIGRPSLYKAVSSGKTLAETDSVKFTYEARCLKPFTPVHVAAHKDPEGNITLRWIRRSRIDNAWRDNVDVPLGEERELYEVEIKKGRRLIRTLESTAPSVTYSKELQIAEFASQIPKKLTATIYQISSVVGRGYGTSITISL